MGTLDVLYTPQFILKHYIDSLVVFDVNTIIESQDILFEDILDKSKIKIKYDIYKPEYQKKIRIWV